MPTSAKMPTKKNVSIIAQAKGLVRLTLFGLISLGVLLIQPLFLIFKNQKIVCLIPQYWHWLVCKIFGIQVIIKGQPQKTQGTFFVGNHLSYFDIPVIGANLKGYFIAKKEVETWPLFGILSKLQKTVFILRSSSGIAEAGNHISKHLLNGNNLVIFPEGTSSDGTDVLPFRSSLFNFLTTDLYRDTVTIQPFTLRLVEINGREPVTQDNRDLYAWYGEMELPPHLWAFACSKGACLELCFHDSFKIDNSDTRKTLSLKSYTFVRNGLTYNYDRFEQDRS